MRKRVAAVIGTVALIGAALPAVVAAPASAASFSCHPVGHAYIVNKEKVAVHASPSRNARVTGYVYKDNKVNAKLECENSGGTWECIGDCHDPEESLVSPLGPRRSEGLMFQGVVTRLAEVGHNALWSVTRSGFRGAGPCRGP